MGKDMDAEKTNARGLEKPEKPWVLLVKKKRKM